MVLVKNAKVLGFLLLTIVGIFPVVWTRSNVERSHNNNNNGGSSMSSGSSSSSVDPNVPPLPLERTEILGVDVLLQRPSSTKDHPLPKGIFFVGHGCSHSNTDFWPSTPETCPECLGLPEEMAIVDMALREFHFVVVAISSLNRDSKCWSVSEGDRVAQVLGTLHTQLLQSSERSTSSSGSSRIHTIPILAFGASSGGNFVGSGLVESMEEDDSNTNIKPTKSLDGFIAQIAAPDPRSHRTAEQHTLPVAVYITMNQDERTDQRAKSIVESLKEERHYAQHIRLDPLPITDSFFHDRISTISLPQSTAMAQALQRAKYLDPATQLLLEDPRRSGWRDVLRPHAPAWDSLRADQSAISEVLNVAQGRHEMTRDGVREAIQYILLKVADQSDATQ